MGAVHGVHLKYAAMSAMCTTGAVYHGREPDSTHLVLGLLWYAALVHALITALFVLRRGEWVLGKRQDGTVPYWSLVVWAAFHAPTWLYTYVHTAASKVPVASEVHPGWWIGGRYANRLGHGKWACTIDLTVEFPEACFGESAQYLLLPCWDGTPPSVQGMERAARLAAECHQRGDIMVHCAHGRGRSTCVMVACLVRAGEFANWRDAFESVRRERKGVKLNSKMTRRLDEWAATFPGGLGGMSNRPPRARSP